VIVNENIKWYVGWADVVGIATRYGLDGPGIESWWGRGVDFPHPASCTIGTGSFPGVKQMRHGFNHPPPSSTKVKERVELYLCSPSKPLWHVMV